MASVAKREWTHKGEVKTAWVVRYKEGGRHRSKQFEKKKEADAFRQKMEREVYEGIHIPTAEATTVKTVCEAFIRNEEIRMRDGRVGTGHYASVKTALDNDIIPELGHRLIKDLEVRDILQLYETMRTRRQRMTSGLTGKARALKNERVGLSPRTARKRIYMLKRVLDFARKRGYTKREIMRDAAAELRGIKRVKIRTFDLEAMQRLIETVNERSPRGRHRAHHLTRCFVYLGAFCGLRVGEIYGLTLDRLNLDDQVIEVRHSLTNLDFLKGPKTEAGNRDVPLPTVLCEALRAWIARYYVPNERRLVFRMEDGSQIRPGTFHTSYWRPLLARAGLIDPAGDNLHFHALRHFAASWMIHNKVSLMEVASALGHETFDETLGTYAHTIVNGSRRIERAEELTAKLLPVLPPPLPVEDALFEVVRGA